MDARKKTIALLAVAMAAGACAAPAATRRNGARADSADRVWPQPPLRARIRFVKTVANPEDLGGPPAFWRRVGEFLFGKGDEHFVRPTGLAASGELIYVADPGAPAVWQLDPDSGRFRRFAEGGPTRLVSPVAVAVGPAGRIYLADSYLGQVLVFDAEGRQTGVIAPPELRRPVGLAYDAARDRLYVADSAAHRIWIFDGEGRPVGAIGRRGTADGEFNFPTYLAVDRDGTLFVTDSMNFRLQVFNLDGTSAGEFGRQGISSGDFASPKGVALDTDGHIYVVDALFDAVQIFDRRGRYLLTFGERGYGPGQFWLPGGLFIDRQDRIYVADSYNQRIQVFSYLGGDGDE